MTGKEKHYCYGDLVKHYKGGLYRYLYTATHTENNEKMVVYQSVDDRTIWCRPAHLFFGTVDVHGHSVFRFRPYREEEDDKKWMN